MSALIVVTGWVLLHFVWQGAAIAALTALALAGAAGVSARLRYWVACCGLVLMIAAAFATAFTVARAATSELPSLAITADASRSAFAALESPWSGAIEQIHGLFPGAARIERMFPLLVAIWFAGATALLLTRWRVWRRVRAAHDAALRLPTSPWQSCARRLADRLGVTAAFRVIELARVDVPMVVGWLRPVVILPVALCAQVPPAQIEALLAHEIAHIHRRDYLVNLVQVAIEAIFFYHPGVWWISGRIRLEREFCCDDLALQLCEDRINYARALAAIQESRAARPGFGLAATDGPLLKRLRRIVGQTERDECPRQGVSVIAAAVLAFGVIATIQAIATAQGEPSPAFAVASVKANQSGEIGGQLHPAPDGSLVALNEPLPALLEFAYGYPAYRIQGLPDWAFRERFDIRAKSDATPPTSIDRIALMLRSLLSDRFMLQTRTQVRQVPVYELRLDRADRRLGPSLSASTRQDCQAFARGRMEAVTQQTPNHEAPCGIGSGFGSIRARGVPFSQLAEALGRFIDRPVVDRTGLNGLFDADVSFRQEGSPFPVPGVLPDGSSGETAPAVFTAVREQLGLKLAPSRGSVDILVVTSIARPTPD